MAINNKGLASGNSLCLPAAYASGIVSKIKNMKTFRKILKTIGHKHMQVFNTREYFRNDMALYADWEKLKICDRNEI